MPTVAVVIIGNEILTGKFADENGPFLIGRLRALGADLCRLVVVPDVVEVIADEVRRCSEAHDRVITTGGVGPTHDDVTLEAVAAAFGLPLVVHPELVALLEKWGLPLDGAAGRMARVPQGTELLHTEMRFPAVKVRNVVVLPGVPKLVRAKFARIGSLFTGETLYTDRLRTLQRETEIAADLGEVQARWPSVAIGSYPRYDEDPHHVIVTLEARVEGDLRSAGDELRRRLELLDEG